MIICGWREGIVRGVFLRWLADPRSSTQAVEFREELLKGGY